uniref:mRNA decay factor PAT1 domain-containing protein n=1 Tax=Phytophthora ramorum TaxID=164328 RepID=H3H4G6_PHYRM
MASEDSLFGSSMDGLPAFFTNGSVDDTKYESLLADLRAHDLLGPVESGAQASEAGGSSLFFNDAFSAVFMGNFQSGTSGKAGGGSSGRAPPGLSAPPGLAAPSEDLKWARGQQEFSRLEEKFHGSEKPTTAAAGSGRAPPPGLSLEQDSELDESQVPGLRGLGLDDDDSVVNAMAPPSKQPPPLPQAPPVPAPPMPPTQNAQPPNAWGAPPMAPPNQQQMQQPHQYMPSPPPHMQGQPPHPMYMQGHPMPPQGMYPRGPPPPPQFYGRGPPPPMRPPFPGPPGAFARNGMPHPPPQMHPPAFKMMTPRDVNFVMQQQMKWLRSSDPFSDDYYFHNYMQKRTRAGVPGRPSVPLPSWKLQHVKSVDPRDVQREVKSRNWESEYHVLGRNTKSSLYRPKQLLNLAGDETSSPPASSPTNAADPERTPSSGGEGDEEVTAAASATAESSSEAASSKHVRGSSPGAQAVAAEAQAAKVLRMSDDVSRNSVFANDTWKIRLQLDRGMQCLLSLQDARHLLDARGINVQQFHSMNEGEMDPSLVELRLRTTSLLLELADLLGVNVTQPAEAESENGAAASRGVMSCDVQQLQRMLTATKGKMLVSRALPLLHPSARFVLLPHLVDHLLSGRAEGGRQLDVNDAGDDRLCQTLVLMLLYVPPAPPAELLTECLQRALNGHDVQSLSIVLHNRARAEALQGLLQRGGSAVQQLTETEGVNAEHATSVKQQWEHHQGVFVQLATAIKQTA